MAIKALEKRNGKLKFLYHKNKFLTLALRRMLFNTLIQIHFDYVYSACYSNLNEKLRNKMQITQKDRNHICLNSNKR